MPTLNRVTPRSNKLLGTSELSYTAGKNSARIHIWGQPKECFEVYLSFDEVESLFRAMQERRKAATG